MEPASRLAPKDGAIAGPGGDGTGCASATDSAGLADDPMVAGSESTSSGTINAALSGTPSGSAYAYPTALGASPLAIGVTPLALGVNTFPASGNVGIGTDTPLKTLHMVNNNTPTIRFEQVAGGGYIPYTWDIGANETNFFIRDQSGGEQLSFRMATGNATNTLTLKNSSVGIGTWDPQSALHVIGKVQVSSLISCSNGVTSDSNGVLGCAIANGGVTQGQLDSALSAALAYTDQREAAIRTDIAAGGASSNAAYTDAREAAVRVDMAAGDAQTLADAKAHADAGDTALRNAITAGDAATIASAKTYADTSSANAVKSANAYTDTRFTAWNDRFTQYQQAVDQRFVATDERISQMGAMSSAMTQMTANAVPAQVGNGRVAIGVGTQSGKAAMSVGYGKRLPGGASFTLGASFSGGENSAGAGFGFDL